MNINKIFQKTAEEKIYSSPIKRGVASTIDATITLFIRATTIQLLGMLWINRQLAKFQQDLNDNFGTETLKNTPEHIQFLISHQLISHLTIFFAIVLFVGALYHAVMNSSCWRATIGKRMMNIMLVEQNNHQSISLFRALCHYFLSIFPAAFILYLLSFQFKNHLSLQQAVMANEANMLLTFILLFWIQINLFTKKKTTAYDMICKTVVINGKTSQRFPWNS